MNRIKTILLSGFAVAATITALSLSVKDNSLESLKANANVQPVGGCTPAAANDCLSSGTGNIYSNYRAF